MDGRSRQLARSGLHEIYAQVHLRSPYGSRTIRPEQPLTDASALNMTKRTAQSFSQSSGLMNAWFRILRSVPAGTSRFRGTIAVSVLAPMTQANFTWLPFWLTSRNPEASRRRLISRKGNGLSRPNLYLDMSDDRRVSSHGRFKMQLQGFAKVVKSFVFGLPLAGDIDVKTLRDEPITLSPNRY